MDQRVEKTKRRLYAALATLLERQSFDRITVSDLVREAGVTRKTFYCHYQDKIDLVEQYQRELSEEILDLQARSRGMIGNF